MTTYQRSIVAIQREGTLPPFFCVHDDFGRIDSFRGLAAELGGDQPFYGLQARGLDGAKPLLLTIEAMADHYIAEIRTVQPQGPYYLGGYALGGPTAFVMAHKLREAGHEVGRLILLDSYACCPHRRVSAGRWARRHLERLGDLSPREWSAYLRVRVTNATALVEREIANRRLERIISREGVCFARDPRMVRDVIRRAARAFDPPTYDGDVTLLAAEPYAWAHPAVHTGWRDVVEGAFDIRHVPGCHDTLLGPENIEAIAREIRSTLRQARPVPAEEALAV